MNRLITKIKNWRLCGGDDDEKPVFHRSNDSLILAFYYIRRRLQAHNYKWKDCPIIRKPEKWMETVYHEAKKIEKERYQELQQLWRSDKTPLYCEYIKIAEKIFKKGINWGRIFVLVAWSGVLAIECFENNEPYMAIVLADYLSIFIDTHLGEWIEANSLN